MFDFFFQELNEINATIVISKLSHFGLVGKLRKAVSELLMSGCQIESKWIRLSINICCLC